MSDSKLKQCPYNKACKCDMKESCEGCEDEREIDYAKIQRESEERRSKPEWKEFDKKMKEMFAD